MKIGIKDTGKAPFIVAELSANHQQNYALAEKTIIAAAHSGADAVKIQTYTPDTITLDCDNEYFQLPKDSPWAGKTLYQLYQEAYTPWEWHKSLKDLANDLGMELFSSPFDPTAVDFLQDLDMPAYKIASFEIFDIPLIKKAAATGKPIILSTGMANAYEIEEAVQACKSENNNNIILLKCTSAYPAPIESANLAMIPYYKEKYGLLSGLSDHTEGCVAAVSAVALGADMIEKHFILDKALGGPDAIFSIEPQEFKNLVDMARQAAQAVGKVIYDTDSVTAPMRKLSRSLFVVKDMSEGEKFTHENVRSIRPGAGMHPRNLSNILGRKASQSIKKGTPLTSDLII